MIFPHLKLFLQFPNILPRFQCDKGAISHILSGANIMAPGLISKEGSMD